ncbi:MAG: lectin-like protein [Lacibacter sp.]
MKKLLLLFFFLGTLTAYTQVTFTGTGTTTSIANNAPAIVVDNALVITTALSLDGARVSISANFITGDVLNFDAGSKPAGITASYNSTSGILTFTGTGTAAEYQTLLRTVTFNTTASSTSQRTILFNLGTAISYSGNNHFYEFITTTYSWTGAKTAAEGKFLFGMQGYLATITSSGENDFIQQKITGDGWIGSSDDYTYINAATGASTYANQAAAEGKWYWVTGPVGEIGTQFSNGNTTPSSVSSRYMNWNPNEPNNSSSTEHYGEIYSSTGTGKWNDLPNTSSLGYVVEYGGMAGDPVVDLTHSRSITMIATQLQTTGSTVVYALLAPATLVDENLTLYSTGNITDAKVTISGNFLSGDVLSYTGGLPGGVTAGTYNSSTGVLSFTGTTTPANWQTLLRTVKFNSSSPTVGNRDITFSVGNQVAYSNGHFYEYISSTASWSTAKTNAAARTYLGLNGYLATITSIEENDFIRQKLSADAWMGASDDYTHINTATGASTYADQAAAEGKWYWVTGPVGEIGTQFSDGNTTPTSVSSRFINWNTNEPNNSSSNEHYGQILTTSPTPGKWNDLPNANTIPYVVEYGGLASDPLVFLSANRTMAISTTLPVSALEFSAIKKGTVAELNWSTETETNTDRFDIMHSTDGIHFKKIETVYAVGNSSSKQTYRFVHYAPVTGNNAYRLEQVDMDGKTVFSETKQVRFDAFTFQLSPNPASSYIVITSKFNKPTELRIIDLNGKVVMRTLLQQQHQTISISALPGGMYIAEIAENKTRIQFIKN